MSITIPPVPQGIIDPANLYNEVYGHEPPLAWNNPEFHDRLAWLLEHGAKVTSWYTLINGSPNGDKIITATAFRIEVSEGVGFDADVLALMKLTTSLAHMVLTLKGGVVPSQITPYPGFEARNPPSGFVPVGEPWIDHPWKPRKLFHAVPETQTRYAVGDIFDALAGHYKKVRLQTKPGSGPFGSGGEWRYAWELVWQR